MTKPKIKLYIGCSLTQAPEDFKASVEQLKATLRDKYEVLDFIGLVAGTPTDVYHWDVQKCVAQCDLFVAICDYPAIGLGYELGTAIERFHKPVLVVAHEDVTLTRLVIGIDAPDFSLKRYQSLTQVAGFIEDKLTTMKVTS
jgi:hypothetical protein